MDANLPTGAAPQDSLFGRLAVQFGLVTLEQLTQAAQLQAREAAAGRSRKLGEILVEQGWMQRPELEALLAAQADRRADPVPQPPADRERQDPLPLPRLEAATLPSLDALTPPPAADGSPPDVPSVAGLVPTVSPAPPAHRSGRSVAQADDLRRWASEALVRRASDLHLHVGRPPTARILGRFEALSDEPLGADRIAALVEALLEPAEKEVLRDSGQVDLAVPLPSDVGDPAGATPRLRVNVYRQRGGIDVVARLIPATPPTLESLGLPLDLARLANHPQGLVLITGPMGCGKTSTLAALLDLINEERCEHILTAEDPIEFVHRPKRCVVNQREVGVHSRSYSRILRAALREDPDVIALAELRDPESVELALSAAETGHLVLATLHTASAVGTVHRILGAFPPARQEQVSTQLAESLRAVISQRLARRADGGGLGPGLATLVVTRAISHLMRDGKLQQIRSQMQTGAAEGMRLLDVSAAQLHSRGVIDAREAARFGALPKGGAPAARRAPGEEGAAA